MYIPKVGPLDLLAVDDDGRLVIVEFKRQQSTRDTIAQILDYASAVRLMKVDELKALANVSASEVDDITQMEPEMILVAAQADESAERIVDYLASKADLKIEVVTFTYAKLADGREILARSILTPDAPAPSTIKPAAKITREELFAVAEKRQVLESVEILNKVTELGWYVEMFPTSGGKIRYWVKLVSDASWRVLFGVYVGGVKFSTPLGQLDVWVRPETVAQFAGLTSDGVLIELRKFEVVNETTTSIVLRLKDQADVSAVYGLLQEWVSLNSDLGSQQQSAQTKSTSSD